MDIDVQMGNMAVTTEPHNLITSGVGSCLVVTLYDPKCKIGALAHTMFPLPSTKNAEHEARSLGSKSSETPSGQQPFVISEQVTTMTKETKYVDVAIDEMLKKMESQGARREYLEAKLIGGANMFPSINSDIGKDNVSNAKRKLKAEGIKIVGECVGGSQGRSVEFSPATGVVTVKIKF